MKVQNFILTILATAFIYVNSFAKTTLVIMNDIHVSPGFHTEEQLIKAIQEIPSIDPDAVIFNGDLTNEGSDKELINIKEILSHINYPLFVLPGNHENNWSQSAGLTYIKLFNEDKFRGIVGEDSVIIIGTNCGPYMKMGDGHVKQEDIHWMNHTLDSLTTLYPNSKVLSFNHYALNPDMDNYRDYISVLKNFPVLAHINGHYHSFNLENIEGTVDLKDITLSSLDRGKGNYGYSILEIEGDSIKVFSKLLEKDTDELYSFKAPENSGFIKPSQEWNINIVVNDSASIFTLPSVANEQIIYGTSLGTIKSVDLVTGQIIWSLETGAPIYSRPVISETSIFVPTINRGIFKLNEHGEVTDCYNDTLPYVADGIYDKNSGLIYQGGFGKYIALDPKNLELVWQYDSLGNYAQGAPVVVDNDIIFGAWDSYLRSLDLSDGSINWKWNNGKNSNMLGPGNVVPVVTGDRIVIVAPDRFMTMIDRATGKTIWRDNSFMYRESLGASNDGKTAYAKTMKGQLIAVDITKDEFFPIWITDLFIGYDHAPCPILVSDGYIYIGSRRGIVSIVEEKTGDLVATIPIGVSEINGFATVPELKKENETTPVVISLIEGKIALINRSL